MKQNTGRKLLSFILTLAMVIGLLSGMSLTAYADNSLAGTIIKIGDSFTLNNDYIEFFPGQIGQGNDTFELQNIGYDSSYNGWGFDFGPSGAFLVSGPETPTPIGFKIASGDGQSSATAYKLKLYYGESATHSVTITPGSNMTKTAESGEASQSDLSGAMTAVVYYGNNIQKGRTKYQA